MFVSALAGCRLNKDIESTASPALIALRELTSYPGRPPAGPDTDTRAILVPLRLRVHETVLSLPSMTTVFGTPATSPCRN